jgi:hypothetical protein
LRSGIELGKQDIGRVVGMVSVSFYIRTHGNHEVQSPTLPNLKARSPINVVTAIKRTVPTIKFAWPEWVREYEMHFISSGLSVLCIENDERLDQI